MTTLLKSNLELPIESRQDLIAYLACGARPRSQWGVGTEMEKLVLDATTGEAASYGQIEALLRRLERPGHWEAIRESEHVIALQGNASSVTLEPGGQLELSGELCPDLHCCHGGFFRHIAEIVTEAEPLGLVFLGLGVQPFTSLADIGWIPKARYDIMGPYMLRTGDMGQRMMKQSAGLQVNLDFSDEADCIDKLRLGQALAPVLYALFANSPIMEGRPSGHLSTRGEIWSRTDADRTGLIPGLFDADAGFATYVDYALDVPMYFIARQGNYLDMTGERYTFRRYMAEGFAGHRPTLSDWDLHLSTLFPEVRLRPQVEFRCADSLPPRMTLAVAALLKGLLYDPDATAETWSLLGNPTSEDWQQAYQQSWRQGLKTPIGGRTLRELSLDLLEVARRSLVRQQLTSKCGMDESEYLEGAFEIADSGMTLAEQLLARWPKERKAQLALLVEHCGFA